jgi:hypothetical protein
MGKVCSLLSGRDAANVIEQLEKAAGMDVGQPSSGDCAVEQPFAAVKQVRLTGRRRSLLIGINYRGTGNELHGCVNDVRRMLPVLESLGFPTDGSSQVVLLDEPGASAESMPTRENILMAIRWLVEGVEAGDALFLHYSGHGGQDDGHETLVPLDFETQGMLQDAELFEELVKPLPQACRLTCLLDSCHSEGALNLPYKFVGNKSDLQQALSGEMKQMVMAKNWAKDLEAFQDGDKMALLKDLGTLGRDLWKLKQKSSVATDTGFVVEEQENVDVSVGEVVALTGCRSDQTSADVGDVAQFHLQPVSASSKAALVMDKGRDVQSAGGALTSAFVEAAQVMPAESVSYLKLLERIRQELADKGFSQVPQVVSSLMVDLNQDFALDTIFIPSDA